MKPGYRVSTTDGVPGIENPTVHPDRAAMLRQILNWPDDDAPRLVYADWLDEQGEHERAEFIRVGIEYAGLQKTCVCLSCVNKRGGGQHHNGRCDGHYQRQSLNRLSIMNYSAWYGIPGPPNSANWDRGFAFQVQMECSAFMQHAASLFAAHPITTVRLTDKRPYFWPDEERWVWSQTSIDDWDLFGTELLPPSIYAYCPLRYPTESAAIDALSAAAVAYGRQLAGLRPLDRPAEYKRADFAPLFTSP